MYWINSGYNYRVSDRGAHFFGRRPVLYNNKLIYNFHITKNIFFNFPKTIKSKKIKTNNTIKYYHIQKHKYSTTKFIQIS